MSFKIFGFKTTAKLGFVTYAAVFEEFETAFSFAKKTHTTLESIELFKISIKHKQQNLFPIAFDL